MCLFIRGHPIDHILKHGITQKLLKIFGVCLNPLRCFNSVLEEVFVLGGVEEVEAAASLEEGCLGDHVIDEVENLGGDQKYVLRKVSFQLLVHVIRIFA